MFRLLGILTLGNLLFGGRHHHRTLRRGLFLGALLGYLSNRDFDMKRVREEARETARKVRKEARKASRTIREEIRNARKAEHDQRMEDRLNTIRAEMEARKAGRETRRAEPEVRNDETTAEVRALPVAGINEAKEIRELVEDMAKNAGTAAMAADVPTIDFPEDVEKYYASRKYGTAQ